METKKIKLIGKVVSDKMSKTVVVAVTRTKPHPLYRKYHKITKRYKAHDENNDYKVGDEVIIQGVRPLSKDKRWEVINKV